MRISTLLSASALQGTLTLFVPAATAAEVCGDGLDNDANGIADEGCYPAGVTGICESPLSCAQTGAVSPETGQLVYHEPADLSPRVPYGPSIAFRRFYMSKYEPGYNYPNDTDYRAPLGYGWSHNYMSWLDFDGAPNPDEAMLHSVTGQDVLFTKDSSAGGYDYYVPQPGYHYDYLRQDLSSPNEWELRTLSGMVYKYGATGPTGKLIGIADSVGNEVVITYNGDGQVDRVTDASGNKYLQFAYQSSYDKVLWKVSLYAGGLEKADVVFSFNTPTWTYELARVTIGHDVARDYTYDSDSKLQSIESAHDVANFYYLDSGAAGTVARIETGRGSIGYDYDVQQNDCIRSGINTTLGACVSCSRDFSKSTPGDHVPR